METYTVDIPGVAPLVSGFVEDLVGTAINSGNALNENGVTADGQQHQRRKLLYDATNISGGMGNWITAAEVTAFKQRKHKVESAHFDGPTPLWAQQMHNELQQEMKQMRTESQEEMKEMRKESQDEMKQRRKESQDMHKELQEEMKQMRTESQEEMKQMRKESQEMHKESRDEMKQMRMESTQEMKQMRKESQEMHKKLEEEIKHMQKESQEQRQNMQKESQEQTEQMQAQMRQIRRELQRYSQQSINRSQIRRELQRYSQQSINRSRRINSAPIERLINVETGEYPPVESFPKDQTALMDAKGATIDALLTFYGEPTNGTVSERRERLKRLLCVD